MLIVRLKRAASKWLGVLAVLNSLPRRKGSIFRGDTSLSWISCRCKLFIPLLLLRRLAATNQPPTVSSNKYHPGPGIDLHLNAPPFQFYSLLSPLLSPLKSWNL
ncbi:hypothetical protein SETIT_6G001700v2 [Setaria italica]|uniref:Uncharacterized protein n=1 Tax=Setaria italica TaxID=4555 RepID=A0A368RI99_SETIT|nr:hypothetical protein SETIT_6G001700v2 [Setaria italica]